MPQIRVLSENVNGYGNRMSGASRKKSMKPENIGAFWPSACRHGPAGIERMPAHLVSSEPATPAAWPYVVPPLAAAALDRPGTAFVVLCAI